MIDFKNASFVKLRPVNDREFASMISPMFVAGERIIQSFKGIRDGVVFTNKRLITINVQGIVDYFSGNYQIKVSSANDITIVK